jgi:hypothetical protein
MSAVDSVHLIRRVAASPEQVFAAWTNAALSGNAGSRQRPKPMPDWEAAFVSQ